MKVENIASCSLSGVWVGDNSAKTFHNCALFFQFLKSSQFKPVSWTTGKPNPHLADHENTILLDVF